MATRNDVARRAGVSVAVVSYVVNNKANVRPETRAKVVRAMQELGYMPDRTARSLKTGKTQQLAVLVNYLGNPFEAGILLHFEKAARAAGYSVIFQTCDMQQEQQLLALAGAVDALIVLGQSLGSETLAFFHSKGKPVISITRPSAPAMQDVPYIDVDWRAAYGQWIRERRLRMDDGCLVFLGSVERTHPLYSRTEAFRQAAEEASEEASLGDKGWSLVPVDGRFESGQAAMLAYLQEREKTRALPATVVLGANDLSAIGALSACREHGCTVPEEVSIWGSEDILMASQTTPALSCLHFPREGAALAAFRLLMALLSTDGTVADSAGLDEGRVAGPDFLPFEWRIRQS